MTSSITGLATGLDTAAIIKQLVAIERNTQNAVKARATKAQVALATWSGLRTQLASLRTTALDLARPLGWRTLTASSSDESAVTVTAGSGTFGGTLSFTVDRLAAAGSVRSEYTVTGTSTLVAADAAIFVAAGGRRIGFATFASDDDLATGEHTITVTQSSAAATKAGTTALATSTVVDGTNDTVLVEVNGTAHTLTIASGTYDRSQLVAALQDAADAAGAAVTVTLNQDDTISVATSREGSAATIRVTGGSALGALGLTTDASAITGTDGKVKVGDAAEQTLTSIDAGSTVVLNATAGTITAVLAGGLRAGSVTGENVSVGDGSLATVVANVNAAGAGVTASAVQVATNTYRLQVTSNSAGALNGVNLAEAELGAALGGLVTLTEAADAQLTVGEGDGAYTIVSETNTVTGLLPGVTVNLKKTTGSPVTVTASRDVGAIADKVQALVDAANALAQAIDTATSYDPETRQASPLTGDATARRLLFEIRRAVSDAVPFANPGSPGLAGVSVDKTGAFTFDRAKFTAAFESDPTGMERVFTQGGSASSTDVTFVSAGDRTRAGTYDVVITQVAERATAVGLEGTWPLGSPPTVRVRVGTNEVSYAIGPTDTQQDVVDALNEAFSAAGLALEASVEGSGIQVATTAYGSAARFEVAWDGSTWEQHTGTDVAGTVDGVAGSGNGRVLSIPFGDTRLGGLALEISATTPGALGTFTYEPGLAQRLSTAILDATDVATGYVTSTEKALRSRVEFIEDQVESMERRLVLYEARLKRQFATLESTLGVLQQQSNWLAGQIAGLMQQ
ncbi:MAG: hypothetical protein KatS3mg009_0303 [Acidimicrobiia bacterium]|nr:MAG: hypothetical protein KatS3mg009_0303 [Acidimicrobiia bacterium]